jgi:hypothetical protein
VAVIFIPIIGQFARQAPRLSKCANHLLGIKFNFAEKQISLIHHQNIDANEIERQSTTML